MPRSQFHADAPIRSDAEDALGVGPFVDRLVAPLLDAAGGPSLVLGLYGAWGQGKSSVLNLLAARLRVRAVAQTTPGDVTTQAVVVRFNPWLYGDVAALLYAFFETLAAEIGDAAALRPPARGALTKRFRAMGGYVAAGLGVTAALLPHATAAGVASAALPTVVDEVARRVSGGEPAFDRHRREVEDLLRRLGAQGRPLRVVVLVDDLDRASGPEAVAMLKLVRLAADLPNMSYVLAMDDARVRDVLARQTSEAYGASFLEKIVQVPVHVPPVDPERLRALVADEAATVASAANVDPEGLGELTGGRTWTASDYDRLVGRRVRTVRDARRLLNAFRFALLTSDHNPDLHAADLLLVCVLQVFYPHVYAGVRTQKRFLLGLDAEWRALLRGAQSREDDLRARQAELLAIARGARDEAAPVPAGPVHNIPATPLIPTPPADTGPTADARVPLAILRRLFPAAEPGREGRDRLEEERRRAAGRVSAPEQFDGYFRLEPPPDTAPGAAADAVFAALTRPAETGNAGGDPSAAPAVDATADVVTALTAAYTEAEHVALWDKVADRAAGFTLETAAAFAARAPDLVRGEYTRGLQRAVGHAVRVLAGGVPVEVHDEVVTRADAATAERLILEVMAAVALPDAIQAAVEFALRPLSGAELPDAARRRVAAAGAARAAAALAGSDSPYDLFAVTDANSLLWRWRDLVRLRDGLAPGVPLAEVQALTARILDADPARVGDVLAAAAGWYSAEPTLAGGRRGVKAEEVVANLREISDPARIVTLLDDVVPGTVGPVRWPGLLDDYRARVRPLLPPAAAMPAGPSPTGPSAAPNPGWANAESTGARGVADGADLLESDGGYGANREETAPTADP